MSPLRALLVVALALVGFVGPTAGAAPSKGCPGARTCADYTLTSPRWHVRAGKPLVIDYWVNVRNAFIPADQVVPMVRAAARVWEVANPRIILRYKGLTDAIPGLPDGKNVVGWAPLYNPLALAGAPTFSTDNVITEADIAISPHATLTWQQCAQRDGACSGHADPEEPGTHWYAEVQTIVTHEFGHWLSLDHTRDSGGSEMTMTAAFDPFQELRYQTLALGEVLGVRAAYPCGACGGAPRVFVP